MGSRFTTLDAMRGVAALAVLFYHLALAIRPGFMPHAYLAVDFFFMLSGFVLWEAYAPRLKQGLAPARFLLMRLVRLYPLFAVGVAVGALGLIVQHLFEASQTFSLPALTGVILLNVLMLPAAVGPKLFPANLPAWSLFLEILVNAAFALALVRLSRRSLALAVWGLAALYLWVLMKAGHADLGGTWATLLPGTLRAGFGFSLGLFLARQKHHAPVQSSAAPVMLLALIVILSADVWGLRAGFYDALCTFLLLPVLLWLGARWQLPAFASPIGAFLGNISYPLYAVHFPLLQAALFVARRLHIPEVAAGAIYLVGVVAFAWWLAKAFDAPARAWASKRLKLRMSAMAPVEISRRAT